MAGRALSRVLTNRNFIFPLGIILGFVFGERLFLLKDLTPFLIGGILAISVSSYRFRSFAPVVGNFGPIIACTVLSFLVYNAIILSLAKIFIHDPYLWTGFVIIAATPPAIAIIPFTINLGGDARYSITGVFGGNLLAVVLTPFIYYLFLGESVVSSVDLLKLLAQILIIPLLVSRFLRRKQILLFIEKYRKTTIDYGYFMVSMIVIGMNRPLMIASPGLALRSLAILALSMFIVGIIYKKVASFWIYDKEILISTNLMLTVKNAGFAAVMALTLFDDMRSALPSAVLSVLIPVFYLVESNMVPGKSAPKHS